MFLAFWYKVSFPKKNQINFNTYQYKLLFSFLLSLGAAQLQRVKNPSQALLHGNTMKLFCQRANDDFMAFRITKQQGSLGTNSSEKKTLHRPWTRVPFGHECSN